MSTNSPAAWTMSIALHALVAGLLALVAYTANLNADKPPRILELVAGAGDNYMATEAPALGTPDGVVSLKVPAIAPTPAPITPAPQPQPQPQPQEDVSPIVPAPPPVKKAEPKVPPPKPKEADPATNFKQQIKTKVQQADRKAKAEAAKERKRIEKEQARISKEQFDREHAAKKSASATSSKSTPTKVAMIDAKGIKEGVVGGSRENTKGGAGGTALKSDNTDVLAAYDALFKVNLRRAFEEDRPPGLSDALKVTIEVRSNADGSLSGGRVVNPSGIAEFDRAVLDALRRMRMPPRPDKRSETVSLVFTMREG